MKDNQVCDSRMNLEECELAILRHAVDQSSSIQNEQIANSPEVKRMLRVTEQFLRRKRLVCYGGTAINNLLPKKAQFYNYDVDVPDYDAYSNDALHDAKSLANEYVRAGFMEVEAKTGVHHGTFKVFVNFIPMADITQLPPELFRVLQKKAHKKNGILYAPPDFLRMGMYLELSRPHGEISRWEKVLKRLTLLNTYYPLKGQRCANVKYQRRLEHAKLIQDTMMTQSVSYSRDDDATRKGAKTRRRRRAPSEKQITNLLYNIVLKAFVAHKCVFFGSNAVALYSQYMPANVRKRFQKVPDFDVLSEDPEETAKYVAAQLETNHFSGVQVLRHEGIGEIIAPHYEVRVGKDTVAFIYEPLACHSYNVFNGAPSSGRGRDRRHNEVGTKGMRIATIDTILSFYLAFMFVDRPYYDTMRLMCMAQYLLDVQRKNRLSQKGLLKRFSITCSGHQPTINEMRSEKAAKFKELKGRKNKREYEEWFLRYHPGHVSITTAEQLEQIKTNHLPSSASRSSRTSRSSHSSSRSSRTSSPALAKKALRLQQALQPAVANVHLSVPSSSSSARSKTRKRHSTSRTQTRTTRSRSMKKRTKQHSSNADRTLRNPKNPFREDIDAIMNQSMHPVT